MRSEPGAERVNEDESASNISSCLLSAFIGVHPRLRFFLARGPYRRGRIEKSEPPMYAEERRWCTIELTLVRLQSCHDSFVSRQTLGEVGFDTLNGRGGASNRRQIQTRDRVR
jgi:hypothetical protein